MDCKEFEYESRFSLMFSAASEAWTVWYGTTAVCGGFSTKEAASIWLEAFKAGVRWRERAPLDWRTSGEAW